MLPNSNISLTKSRLSVRAVNALRKSGYKSLSECTNLRVDDLFKIKNIGAKTANEIIIAINSFKRKYHQAEPKEKYQYLIKALSIPISKIHLSARTTHVLRNTGAKILLDLVQIKSKKMLEINFCGKKTLREINDFLRQLDLQLDERLEKKLIYDVKTYRVGKSDDDVLNDFKHDYPERCDVISTAQVKSLDATRIKVYNKCFNLYIEGGTLKFVAKKMHLTRERVRQILNKGTKLGLFNYLGRDYNYIDKNKIIDGYYKYLNFGSVAKINGVTTGYLKRMLTAYKITDADLKKIRENSNKNKCIESFRRIEAELGHSPTTTELQRRNGWRYLSMKISRMWGSIDAFREELQIPKPTRTFPEASRKWKENHKRIAFIIRMQNLDQIRDCLTKTSPLSCNEIACECNIKPPKALRLLNLLLMREEIIREGLGSARKYKLNRQQETR